MGLWGILVLRSSKGPIYLVMQTIEEIDTHVERLDEQIMRLVAVDSLKTQLSATSHRSLDIKELGQLQARDGQIVTEIEQLQELWVITTLKKEVEVNLEMFEFENVFASLQKLTEKIQGISLNSASVKTKWLERATQLQDEVLETFTKTWKQLVSVDEESSGAVSVTFHEEVEIDDFAIAFESLADVVETFALPQNIFNLAHTIDTCFMNTYLDDGYVLTLNGSTLSSSKTDTHNILTHIQSTKALVDFINLIPQNTRIINYISTPLFDKLKELVTENADQILGDQSLKDNFLELGQYVQAKNFTRGKINEWITHELYELTIQQYLNQHLDMLRRVFEEPDFSTVTRTIQSSTPSLPSSNPVPMTTTQEAKSKNKSDADADEDEDGWDAWGDDDQDQDDKGAKQTKADDDDGWEAWGDDDDEDEPPAPKPKKLLSKLSKKSRSPTPTSQLQNKPQPTPPLAPPNTYQTTHIPDQVLSIIKSYIASRAHLPEDQHSSHMSKLNYLTTTYFMLGSRSYPSTLLQYNDGYYLTQELSLPNLKSLNDRLLFTFIKTYEDRIANELSHLNGLDPGISAGQSMLVVKKIQSLFDEMFKELSFLERETYSKITVSVIGEFYQLIIDSVMGKGDIGEAESVYLSKLIDNFLQMNQPFGAELKNSVKNWEKLRKISYILNAHLKEIMETFYNGEFYEFETDELVSLIDKLFADSDLKRSYVAEIRELRAEADNQ